jgi:hypothetical protein
MAHNKLKAVGGIKTGRRVEDRKGMVSGPIGPASYSRGSNKLVVKLRG